MAWERMGGLGFGLPRMTPVVKVLLIINVAVFMLQQFLPLDGLFGVTVGAFWQPWRYVSFQFLHANFMHILLNMLGLWFLGAPLEEAWGQRRFLGFYLSCGIFAGLAYVVIGWLTGLPSWLPIIGASGGVFGIVLACAVLFPSFQIIFLFFPVPIRLASVIIFGGMIFTVIQGAAHAHSRADMGPAMSDVAHLGGAGMAAFWIWGLPRLRQHPRFASTPNRGNWERRMRERQKEQEMVDRILDKIRREGIGSLTWLERRRLRQAGRHEPKP